MINSVPLFGDRPEISVAELMIETLLNHFATLQERDPSRLSKDYFATRWALEEAAKAHPRDFVEAALRLRGTSR
ncbi:MAG: hypothetical protein JWP01_3388 [Myxococcales bacterium]|nr:hypothetical protein [Myxococcales bacterium]